jgi:hypothetical protein
MMRTGQARCQARMPSSEPMSWKDQSNLHFRSPGGLTFSLSPNAAEKCEKRARMENDACANPRTLPMSEYGNTQETARSGERVLALIDRSRCQMGPKFSITTQHEEVFHSRVSASRVASVPNGAMSVFVGTKRHGRSKQDAVVPDSLRRRGGRRIAIYVPALIGGGAERVAALLATAHRGASGHAGRRFRVVAQRGICRSRYRARNACRRTRTRRAAIG